MKPEKRRRDIKVLNTRRFSDTMECIVYLSVCISGCHTKEIQTAGVFSSSVRDARELITKSCPPHYTGGTNPKQFTASHQGMCESRMHDLGNGAKLKKASQTQHAPFLLPLHPHYRSRGLVAQEVLNQSSASDYWRRREPKRQHRGICWLIFIPTTTAINIWFKKKNPNTVNNHTSM